MDGVEQADGDGGATPSRRRRKHQMFAQKGRNTNGDGSSGFSQITFGMMGLGLSGNRQMIADSRSQFLAVDKALA
jgi:hypothetical protein